MMSERLLFLRDRSQWDVDGQPEHPTARGHGEAAAVPVPGDTMTR